MLRLVSPGAVHKAPALAVVERRFRREHWGRNLALRCAGHLPYVKLVSGFILPDAVSMPAAVAITLCYAVVSHEVSADLAARQWLRDDALAPLKGSCFLLVIMIVAATAIALVASPASFGPHIGQPHRLAPAFGLLLLPCCLSFAVAQWHARSHNKLLFRLGLLAVTFPARRDTAPSTEKFR